MSATDAAEAAATTAEAVAPWWASGAFAIAGSLVVALLTLAGSQWLRRDEHNHAAADTKADVIVALLTFIARHRRVDKHLDRIERTYQQVLQEVAAVQQRIDAGNAAASETRKLDSAEERLRSSLSHLESAREDQDQLGQEWTTLRFQAQLHLSRPVVQAFGAMYEDGRDHWYAIEADIMAWGRREVQATRAGRRALNKFLGEANREPAWKAPEPPEQKA